MSNRSSDSSRNNLPAQALTIKEPWGWAITTGFKTIENRTRPVSLRGRIAIHTSLSQSVLDLPDDELDAMLWNVDTLIYDSLDREPPPGKSLLQLGCLIGSVEIVDCVRFDPHTRNAEKAFDPFSFDAAPHLHKGRPVPEIPHEAWAGGPWCYVLAHPHRYRRPIPARGKLSFWKLDEAQLAAVRKMESSPSNWITDPGEPSIVPASQMMAPLQS